MNNINDPYIHGMSDPQSEVGYHTPEEYNGTCCEKDPVAIIDGKWYCDTCVSEKYQEAIEEFLTEQTGFDVTEHDWYESADYVAHTDDDYELESIAICTTRGLFSFEVKQNKS